jgi:hypothetical protein
MTNIILAILAIARAVPVIAEFLEKLSVAFTASRLASFRKENLEALRKAVKEYDQRDLEKAIGNPNAGEPSGDAGSEIVDSIPPGVNS